MFQMEARVERTEAVSRLHDQMLRLKKDDAHTTAKIIETGYEQLEHRSLCFEKRLLKLETDYGFVKVQLDHEIPRDRSSFKK